MATSDQQKRGRVENLTNAGKGRPKGVRNKATIEIRESARLLVEEPAYRASLRERIIAGKAPHMEPVLFYYAYGKPKETHEISGTVTLAALLGIGELAGGE